MVKKSKKIKAEKYKADYYENEFEIEKETSEEQYEEVYKNSKNKNNIAKFMKIFNIFFVLTIIIMLIISIDVVCITKYNIGPFFAINTKTYKDGGTKEFYGIGYKVIKYNELIGRRDTKIGFWNLKYSIDPLILDDIDLAIEFQNSPELTINKYYKEYIKIKSTIKKINTNKKEIILEYKDPDGKYTLEIICEMELSKEELINYNNNDTVFVKGTIYQFLVKENNKPNRLFLNNCFIEEN